MSPGERIRVQNQFSTAKTSASDTHKPCPWGCNDSRAGTRAQGVACLHTPSPPPPLRQRFYKDLTLLSNNNISHQHYHGHFCKKIPYIRCAWTTHALRESDSPRKTERMAKQKTRGILTHLGSGDSRIRTPHFCPAEHDFRLRLPPLRKNLQLTIHPEWLGYWPDTATAPTVSAGSYNNRKAKKKRRERTAREVDERRKENPFDSGIVPPPKDPQHAQNALAFTPSTAVCERVRPRLACHWKKKKKTREKFTQPPNFPRKLALCTAVEKNLKISICKRV